MSCESRIEFLFQQFFVSDRVAIKAEFGLEIRVLRISVGQENRQPKNFCDATGTAETLQPSQLFIHLPAMLTPCGA